MINLSVFHDYDIRGIYGTELDEEFYELLGRAAATWLNQSPIAVGRDARVSSPALFEAFTKGVLSTGTDVIDLGEITTEMHHFASGRYEFPLTVIISASHNPPDYNGAKMDLKGANSLNFVSGYKHMKDLIEKNKFKTSQKKGTVIKKDISADWIQHILSFVDVSTLTDLTAVIDTGNGMAGPTWELLKKHLTGVKLIELFWKPDGTFPNHLPYPLQEVNLVAAKKAIHESRADLAVAVDGDADRAAFIDEEGIFVSGTVMSAILSEIVLEKEKGTILYNAGVGRVVPQLAKKHGVEAIRTRVGYSYIKQTMRETNAVFAGEHSLHFFYRKNYNSESSAITALLLMEHMKKTGKKLSQLRQEYDIYPQSGELNFKAEDRNAIFARLKADYKDAQSVDELDGLSVWYPTYWFNVRGSNTEPLIRLNIEADNTEILEKMKHELVTKIESMGAQLKLGH